MTEEQVERLIQLRIHLKTTDYKIIKSYEYHLAGLDAPYDISELHAEREVIREEIRQGQTYKN